MGRLFVVGLMVSAIVSCNGPLPFLSGGQLDGEVQPTPTPWPFGEDFGVIQLETNPLEPYSINIAYTLLDGRLYVHAGDTKTQWVENMEADPRVRFRIDNTIYELRAERVSEASEIAQFAKAWLSHSMFHRDPMALDEIWLYRLAPR